MRSFVIVATATALVATSLSGCHRRARPEPVRKEPFAAAQAPATAPPSRSPH